MSHRQPPRLAERLLVRVLPPGKRGESIRGDLLEEFRTPAPGSRIPASVWYWQQAFRLTLRYFTQPTPQRIPPPRRSPMLMDLTSDLRTAIRMTTRNLGTSSLIVLTLAAAIAGATVGFTFADFALLRGLPVDDEARVVSVFATDTEGSNPRARVSGPDFLDMEARATAIEKPAAYTMGYAPLIQDGQSQTLSVAHATANLFAAMGQPALRGRTFAAGDDRAGAEPVAVLSHRYWQQNMSGRDAVLGQTLQIGRRHFTIVGVLSPGIEFGNISEIDVWLPLYVDPSGARDARNMRFFARLKPGVEFDQAVAEMAAIGDALAGEHPETNGGWRLRLIHVSELTGGDGFWVIIALFVLSIGLLIAIATANVSNLVLARTLARSRELAVRTALGARRGRLVRQFVIEGFVLCVAAALFAMPLAWAGLQAIAAVSPEVVFQQLTIDLHELGFVAAVTLICPLVFSIAPLRVLSRPDMRQVLAGSGTRGSTASSRGRGALVVVQVALAVVLLTVSSLSVRSIRSIYSAPTGLNPDGVLVLALDFNDVQYPDATQVPAVAREVRDRLSQLPGVRTVGMINALPILGDRVNVPLLLETATGDPNEVKPTAVVSSVSPEAGPALGVSLVGGTWWDESGGEVAVVSRAAADRYFGGVAQAIGHRFKVTEGGVTVSARIIGVSTDVANTDRTSAAPARVWLPLAPQTRRLTYVVTADRPGELAPGIRSAIAQTAAAIPIESMLTLEEAMRQAASSDYAVIGTLSGFALLALVLATTGLFGVVSFAVSQRTAEFGTRMALGASAGDVIGLVARQSLRLLLMGVSLGLTLGVGVGFAMGGALNGLSPLDPLSIGGVIGLLVTVTLVATALPAWRASRIDPVIALRAE
jgi:putative ABC transport system permease protein